MGCPAPFVTHPGLQNVGLCQQIAAGPSKGCDCRSPSVDRPARSQSPFSGGGPALHRRERHGLDRSKRENGVKDAGNEASLKVSSVVDFGYLGGS